MCNFAEHCLHGRLTHLTRSPLSQPSSLSITQKQSISISQVSHLCVPVLLIYNCLIFNYSDEASQKSNFLVLAFLQKHKIKINSLQRNSMKNRTRSMTRSWELTLLLITHELPWCPDYWSTGCLCDTRSHFSLLPYYQLSGM